MEDSGKMAEWKPPEICFPIVPPESVWSKYFGLWSSLKVCKFQGNHGQWTVINFSQFQLFQQFQLLATHPSALSHMASICAYVPGACRCQCGQKGPCSPNSGDLIPDCCFWFQRYRQRSWGSLLVTAPPIVPSLPPLVEINSRKCKGSVPFSCFSFSYSFFFFEGHMLKTRTYQNNWVNGEN